MMGVLSMVFLASAMVLNLAQAQVEIPPQLLEPINLSVPVDEITITDLDSLPNYAKGQHDVVAVGIWRDQPNTDYVIFVLEIRDEGVSYNSQIALHFLGSNSFTSEPRPRIQYEGSKYLVSITHPDNGKLYLFEQSKSGTSLTGLKMLKVTLPPAYSSDPYRVGYAGDYLSIVSRKTGQWWATSVRISTASTVWTKTQPLQSISVCSSCAIRGFDTYFAIGGQIDGEIEILILDSATAATKIRVRFTGTNLSVSGLKWQADSLYAVQATSGNWKIGSIIVSNHFTYMYGQLFFEFDSTGNIIKQYEMVYQSYVNNSGSPKDLLSTKVQFGMAVGAIPYFFFMQENQLIVAYFDSAGKRNAFQSAFAPRIDPSDVIQVNGITMLQDSNGFIFGGQIKQYMDTAGIQTITKAPSGFFSGFDNINSCMKSGPKIPYLVKEQLDLTKLVADFPTSATILTTDSSSFTGSDGTISAANSGADFQLATFAVGSQYTELTGACTVPQIYMPVITDQIYVINPVTSTNFEVSFTPVTYGPVYFQSQGYTLGVTQQVGTTGVDPTWATLDNANGKITIATTSISDSGVFTLAIDGDLTGTANYSGKSTFQVTLVKIVTTSLNDMTLSQGKGDETQTISAWSFSPNTGVIASYSFKYELQLQTGAAAPAWISVTGGNTITVDDSQLPPVGEYNLHVIATAIDENSNELTGHSSTQNFKVTVYTLTASSLTNQYFSIGQTSPLVYTWPAFATTLPPVTYTVLIDGSGADAATTYSWITSFTSSQITINTSTIGDAGEYDLILRGTLADTAQYPSSQTTAEAKFKIWLVDLLPAAQQDMTYIIGDSASVTEAIDIFSYSPVTAGSYTITYSVSIVGGTPTIPSLQVVTNSDVQIGTESDKTLFGSHTIRLSGQMNDVVSTVETADFTLNLIKLEATLADQSYRIEAANNKKSVIYSAVIQSPSAGGSVPAYTYTYSMEENNGSSYSAANTAIFNLGAGSTFEIQSSDVSAAKDYTMAVKATVNQRTTAVHYITFKAKLFTFTTQVNSYQVYTIGSSAHTYKILAPTLVSVSTFIPTCELYQSDGTTLATTYSWLSFNKVTEIVTVTTSTAGLGGEYNLRYKCTLDDDDLSIEWTSVDYYLLEASSTAQTDINYIVSQDVIRQAISPFTYSPSTLPLTGSVTWTYSLATSTGNPNVCTIASDSSSDLLVGMTSNVNAGITTGKIIDNSLAGSSVYLLSATLTGTDSLGRAFTLTSPPVNVNIEILYISASVAVKDMFYRTSEPALTETFTAFTQSKTGGSTPTYTLTYELQDWDGSSLSSLTASQVSINSATRTITVVEPDVTFPGASYDLAVKATVNEVPSAYGYATFKVMIYTFIATPQQNAEYLVGTNPLVHKLNAYGLSAASGSVVSGSATVTYSLMLGDGSSATGVYSWLTIDLTNLQLTINTSKVQDTGIYEFQLQGIYGASPVPAITTFKIYVVRTVATGTLPQMHYKVGNPTPTYIEKSPFELLNQGDNHKYQSFDCQVIDPATNLPVGSTIPKAIDCIKNRFTVYVRTDDDQYVGYYKVRITGTAKDTTGVDTNTATSSIDFSIVIYQVYTFPLENQQRIITYNGPLYRFPKFEVKPPPSWEVPEVPIDYGLRITKTDNNITEPNIWEFTDLYEKSGALNIFTENYDFRANYTTELIGRYRVWESDLNSTELFNIELILPARNFTPEPDEHTYFQLDDHSMDISEGWEFSLGSIFGKYGDYMEVEFSMQKVDRFATFEPGPNKFQIEQGALNETDVGLYKISAIAKFQNETHTEHFADSFYLTIRDDTPIIVVPPARENDLINIADITLDDAYVVPDDWDKYDQLDLPRIVEVVENTDLEEFNKEQPIPYIRDLATTGLLLIEWDRDMVIPKDAQAINPSRVAVEIRNTTDDTMLEQRRRQLNVRYFDMYDNFEDIPEWYLILQALELKVRPGDIDTDPASVNLTWSLESFSERQMYIQIYFDYPERLSDRDAYDTLEVRFWGSKFFESKDGRQVRFGSVLERTILRQIEQETATWLWRGGLGFVWAIWAICLFTILLTGRLLATWMFLNSLQLVTHIVLFKSQLPGSAAYSLGQLLYAARWNPFPEWHWIEHTFGYLKEGGHDVRFFGYGYESLYMLANLNIIIILSLIVLTMWLLLFLKDLFAARCSKTCKLKERIWYDKFEGKWHNLAHRFTYEIFLELLICTLISYAVRKPYTNDNFSTPEEQDAIYEVAGGEYEDHDKNLAIFAACILSAFFLWAVSFVWQYVMAVLCCRKTRSKIVTSAFDSCVRNCVPTLRSCPKKCPQATCNLIKCKCLRKKKHRRRSRIAKKYIVTDLDKSAKHKDKSGLDLLEESSSGSDFDYVIERKKSQLYQKDNFIKDGEVSEPEPSDSSVSGVEMDPMLMIRSAWIDQEAEYVPKNSFTQAKTKMVGPEQNIKLNQEANTKDVNSSTTNLIQTVVRSDMYEPKPAQVVTKKVVVTTKKTNQAGYDQQDSLVMSSHDSYMSARERRRPSVNAGSNSKQQIIIDNDNYGYSQSKASDDLSIHYPQSVGGYVEQTEETQRVYEPQKTKTEYVIVKAAPTKVIHTQERRTIVYVDENGKQIDPNLIDRDSVHSRGSNYRNRGVTQNLDKKQSSNHLNPKSDSKQSSRRYSHQVILSPRNNRQTEERIIVHQNSPYNLEKPVNLIVEAVDEESSRSINSPNISRVQSRQSVVHQVQEQLQLSGDQTSRSSSSNRTHDINIDPTVRANHFIQKIDMSNADKTGSVDSNMIFDLKNQLEIEARKNDELDRFKISVDMNQMRHEAKVPHSKSEEQINPAETAHHYSNHSMVERAESSVLPVQTTIVVQSSSQQVSGQPDPEHSDFAGSAEFISNKSKVTPRENYEAGEPELDEVKNSHLGDNDAKRPTKKGKKKRKKRQWEDEVPDMPNIVIGEDNLKQDSTQFEVIQFNRPSPRLDPLKMTSAAQSSVPWQNQEPRQFVSGNLENYQIDPEIMQYSPVSGSQEQQQPVGFVRTAANRKKETLFKVEISDDEEIQNPMDVARPESTGQADQPQKHVYARKQTKKMHLYEGGEVEDSEDPEQSDVSELSEKPQKIQDSLAFQYAKILKASPIEESERLERAKKHVDKEYELMAQTHKDYPRSQTLLYGLRFDWKSHMQTFHISFFLLRRIALAFLLVFGEDIAYWGIQIMIATSIVMLCMLLTFNQWRVKIIQIQHIVNELFLYLLCWLLLVFQGAFPRMNDETYEIFGYAVIGVVAVFVIFNLICIIYEDIIVHFLLHCRRCQNIIEFRKNRHKLSDLNRRSRFAWKQLLEWRAEQRKIEWEKKYPKKAKALKKAQKKKLLEAEAKKKRIAEEKQRKIDAAVAKKQRLAEEKQRKLDEMEAKKKRIVEAERQKAMIKKTIVTSTTTNIKGSSPAKDKDTTLKVGDDIENQRSSIVTQHVTSTNQQQNPDHVNAFFPGEQKVMTTTTTTSIMKNAQQHSAPQNNQSTLQVQQVFEAPTERELLIVSPRSQQMRRMSYQQPAIGTISIDKVKPYAMQMTTVGQTNYNIGQHEKKHLPSERAIIRMFTRPGSARINEQKKSSMHEIIVKKGGGSDGGDDLFDHISQHSEKKNNGGDYQYLDVKGPEFEDANLTKTSFTQVGLNLNKWKMPSAKAIEEVDDSENHSRLGSAAQIPDKSKPNEYGKIHDEIDSILFAKKKTLTGLNRQNTINRLLDVWGTKNRRPQFDQIETTTRKNIEFKANKAVDVVKKTYDMPDIVNVEPMSLEKILGKTTQSDNIFTVNDDQQPNGVNGKNTTATVKTKTYSTSLQPKTAANEEVTVETKLASNELPSKLKELQGQSRLQKMDTLTMMLNEVDSSSKFRAARNLGGNDHDSQQPKSKEKSVVIQKNTVFDSIKESDSDAKASESRPKIGETNRITGTDNLLLSSSSRLGSSHGLAMVEKDGSLASVPLGTSKLINDLNKQLASQQKNKLLMNESLPISNQVMNSSLNVQHGFGLGLPQQQMSSTARLGSSFKGTTVEGQLGSTLQAAGAAGSGSIFGGQPKNWFDEAIAERRGSK